MGVCVFVDGDADLPVVLFCVVDRAVAPVVTVPWLGLVRVKVVVVASANEPRRPRMAHSVITREGRYILVFERRAKKTRLSIFCIPIGSSACKI